MSNNQNTEYIFVGESPDSSQNEKEEEMKEIFKWVDDIKNEETRDHALECLSKKRESVSDLAIYLWYSTGTVAALLQEIIYTYQFLTPPKLTLEKSNKICGVIALLQCVAQHNETRHEFFTAQLPIFLYPFLNTSNKSKPYEYLRLTALGVIGALVKVDDPDVISFLLSTEIIPLCLRIMERGSELSKTVACFIIQRILLDNNGLKYICEKPERLFTIIQVFGYMIRNKPSPRLIKHIIRTYSRLSENQDARVVLRNNLPDEIRNESFFQNLDDSSKKWMQNLFKNLKETNNNITKNNIEIFTKNNNNIQNVNLVNNNSNNNNSNNINNNNNNNSNNNNNNNNNTNTNSNNLPNNMNHQMNINNNDLINHNNINANVNMMILNQLNIQQSQGFMLPPNVGDFSYNMYNTNDNYLNKAIYIGNQNTNKGYNNMSFYNGYKNN